MLLKNKLFGTRKPVKPVKLVKPVKPVPAKWCHEVLVRASLPRAGGQDDGSSHELPQIILYMFYDMKLCFVFIIFLNVIL